VKLTREQLDEMMARNPALKKRNFDLTIQCGDDAAIKSMAADHAQAIRRNITQAMGIPMLNVQKIERTKKPLLNKTETLWKAELERRGHQIILVQALTFRLGDRLTYRPDLVTVEFLPGDEDVKASMATAAGYGAEMPNDAPIGVREHDGRGRKEGEDTKSDRRNRGISGGISITCYETKAPHRFKNAGITKVKAAAAQYPFIKFVLVMRNKGTWTEKEIGQ
jgi:hypothetical protein